MKKDTLIPIALFLLIFLIYHFTGIKKTHFDYFVRLADAFLHQKLYLATNPSHLNELIPLNGKYYVVYPPMPAIAILPFVFLFGTGFNQTLFAQFIGALNGVLVYLLFRKLKYSKKIAVLLALTLALATNHWYLSSVGSAWYLGHIIAIFFLLLAFLSLFSSKIFLAGLFLGAAYFSRLPIILTGLYFIFLLYPKKGKTKESVKKISRFIGGLAIFVFLNALYNFLRFGSFFNIGYSLIPNVLKEPWYQKGIFHYSYLPKNLSFFFTKMPVISEKFPFITPSLEGMAFWLTSLVFLILISANWKKGENIFALVVFVLGIILVLTHGGVGFSQFGYRYSIDFVLLLLFPLADQLSKSLSFIFYFLLILSISINLWGVLLINKFNLWGW